VSVVPAIAIPHFPSLSEVEAVVDQAMQSKGTLRRAFVDRLFDHMLSKRSNAKGDGFVHAALGDVVAEFGPLYAANVPTPPLSFDHAIEWVCHHKFKKDMLGVVYERLQCRINVAVNEYRVELSAMEFVATNEDTPLSTLNRWLDHIDILFECGEGRPYISIRRYFSILVRSAELITDRIDQK
jgi:hypothetical protein